MSLYANRRGEHLWYEDRGIGCPIVLLHGWCMSSAVWKYQYEGLKDSYRLLAPDLRGHGRSLETSGSLDFNSFAGDLVDFFDTLRLEKVILLGWSMGAQIALQASAELSHRLAGMVLVSATPRFTAADDFSCALAPKEASGMRLKVQRNKERALNGFYTRMFTEGELESHYSAAEIKQLLSGIATPDIVGVLDALDALSGADMRPLLPAVDVPTLILNGGQDLICLPQASSYLKAHIRGAEQIVYHHCGHAPFLTHSEQFNADIICFARRVSEQNT